LLFLFKCDKLYGKDSTAPDLEEIMNELKPGIYRHFKGNLYELIGIAKHSETLEPMVVYRALYGEGGLWVRPAHMWSEQVERDDYKGPRFIFVK
jgi:hypothetical protein